MFVGVDGISDAFMTVFDIVDRAGVGLAPGTAFRQGGEAYFRLCFARRPDQVEETADRLVEWIKNL